MKEQILKLRSEGKSYNEICELLGCSKGTVAYHCGEGQKEKYRRRATKYRHNNPLQKRVDNFQRRVAKPTKITKSSPKKCLRGRCDDFQRREGSKYGKRDIVFTYHDVLEKFGENTTCYLTGRKINLYETRTYNFDHIIPAIKGGPNTFDNLGIACREANIAKGQLSHTEFLELCKTVLTYNGYEIRKSGK
jgi:hypothetical protein